MSLRQLSQVLELELQVVLLELLLELLLLVAGQGGAAGALARDGGLTLGCCSCRCCCCLGCHRLGLG